MLIHLTNQNTANLADNVYTQGGTGTSKDINGTAFPVQGTCVWQSLGRTNQTQCVTVLETCEPITIGGIDRDCTIWTDACAQSGDSGSPNYYHSGSVNAKAVGIVIAAEASSACEDSHFNVSERINPILTQSGATLVLSGV